MLYLLPAFACVFKLTRVLWFGLLVVFCLFICFMVLIGSVCLLLVALRIALFWVVVYVRLCYLVDCVVCVFCLCFIWPTLWFVSIVCLVRCVLLLLSGTCFRWLLLGEFVLGYC